MFLKGFYQNPIAIMLEKLLTFFLCLLWSILFSLLAPVVLLAILGNLSSHEFLVPSGFLCCGLWCPDKHLHVNSWAACIWTSRLSEDAEDVEQDAKRPRFTLNKFKIVIWWRAFGKPVDLSLKIKEHNQKGWF